MNGQIKTFQYEKIFVKRQKKKKKKIKRLEEKEKEYNLFIFWSPPCVFSLESYRYLGNIKIHLMYPVIDVQS